MDQKVDGSVHNEHRQKLAKEAREAKKKKPAITERRYELRPDSSNRRGGKIVEVMVTKTATHRRFVCREKERPEWVAKLKKEKQLTIA